jgi:hypothetical protein
MKEHTHHNASKQHNKERNMVLNDVTFEQNYW